MAANVIKSVIFKGKVSYRIVRADPVGDDTVLVPETQEIDGNNEHAEESITSQLGSSTLPEHQKRNDDNISTFIEDDFARFLSQ